MDKDTLINQYLQTKQTELENKSHEIQHKREISLKYMLRLLAIILVSAIAIIMVNRINFAVKYNRFMENCNTYTVEQLSSYSDIMSDKTVFKIYEDAALGNTNSNLINYGCYAFKGGYKVYLDANNGLPMLQTESETKEIADYPISYVNIADDGIFFRNNNDRRIYKCDLNCDKTENVIDGKVGQFVVTNNIIYYINFEDKGKLYSFDLNSGSNDPLIEEDIVSFVKAGEQIIYLDSGNKLKKYSDGKKYTIQSDVEKFYFNGDIIAQNNGKIISFSLKGKNPKLILKENAELLGADSENIYYSVNSEIYGYDTGSAESFKIAEGCDFYKAIYKTNNGYYIIGAEKNETTNTYDDKIMSISGE